MLSFGRFTLTDPRGDSMADVIVAPEYILLKRGRGGPVHDVSYLTLWSAERSRAIVSELVALSRGGPGAVDARTPELAAILHAIGPACSATFLRAGHLPRLFTRRRLKAELTVGAPARATESAR